MFAMGLGASRPPPHLYAWGNNAYGRLGVGDTHIRRTPVVMHENALGGHPPSLIACGAGHVVVTSAAGRLYGCGKNHYGQLGVGDDEDRFVLTPMPASLGADERVAALAAGDSHVVAVTTQGRALVCGCGWNHALGVGAERHATALEAIDLPFAPAPSSDALAAGQMHTVIVDAARTRLCAFGWNCDGQCGDGSQRNMPRAAEIALPADDAAGEIAQVAAGARHTLVLRASGAVWACGDNAYGQCGAPAGERVLAPRRVAGLPASVVRVAAGKRHSLAVDASGAAYAFGNTEYGRLGVGPVSAAALPAPTRLVLPAGVRAADVACGDSHSIVVDTHGVVWAAGSNECAKLGPARVQPPGGTYASAAVRVPLPVAARAVACGANNTLVLG